MTKASFLSIFEQLIKLSVSIFNQGKTKIVLKETIQEVVTRMHLDTVVK